MASIADYPITVISPSYTPNYYENAYIDISASTPPQEGYPDAVVNETDTAYNISIDNDKYFIFGALQSDGKAVNFWQIDRNYGTANARNIEVVQSIRRQNGTQEQNSLNTTFYPFSAYQERITAVSVNMNIPLFATVHDAEVFMRNGDLSLVLNAGGDVELENDEHYVHCTYQRGTWTYSGVTNTSSPSYRWYEWNNEAGYKCCLYKASGTELKLIQQGAVYNGRFSDNGADWYEMLEPWTDYYSNRTNELGTINYSTVDIHSSFFTDLPIWESEEDANAYLNGELDITNALNYDTISGTGLAINETGIEEIETEMGQAYNQSFFSQQYICSRSALTAIANKFYDVSTGGIWDDLKKGLEMYGENPIECIQSIAFFPVNLVSIFGNNASAQNYIYFGGYKMDLDSNVHKIIFPNGYYNLGTITIKKSFNNWRDFEPYTKLWVQLPYIGRQQLDLARYYGKSVQVRYYFDTRSNACMACLIANGVLMDYYNGQMGVTMPITLTDFSAYSASQANVLIKGASTVTNYAGTGAGLGSMVGVAGGVAGGIAGGVAGIGQTVFEVTQNNKSDFNKTKGGSSSMLNEFLPQYCYFIFEVMQVDEAKDLVSLYGKPSNKSGRVGSFSGFLQVDSVELVCTNATDSERAEILQALKAGIYI